MDKKKLVSIVIPVFNEQENLVRTYKQVKAIMDQVGHKYDYEFVFTDNHSTDDTYAEAEKVAKGDQSVRVFRFSRNFGFQRSIATGYAKAKGDAAIQIDCDLQDPPELILEFLKAWEQGYKVVYGIRRSRQEGFFITRTRRLFYRLIDSLSEDTLPHDAGDFRLVDRCVLDELTKIYDYQPYLRGTIASLGFNQKGIPYDRRERRYGQSKFPFSELMKLALDGILNHSVLPLRVATICGLLISVATIFGLVGYIIGKLFYFIYLIVYKCNCTRIPRC